MSSKCSKFRISLLSYRYNIYKIRMEFQKLFDILVHPTGDPLLFSISSPAAGPIKGFEVFVSRRGEFMSLGFVIFVSPIWLFAVPSESTIFWREEASSWKFMNEDDSNWRSGRWSELVWDNTDVETVESLRSWMSRDDFNVEKFSPGCLGGLRLEQESSPGTWQCSYSHPPLWHILICTNVQTYNRLYENVFF